MVLLLDFINNKPKIIVDKKTGVETADCFMNAVKYDIETGDEKLRRIKYSDMYADAVTTGMKKLIITM